MVCDGYEMSRFFLSQFAKGLNGSLWLDGRPGRSFLHDLTSARGANVAFAPEKKTMHKFQFVMGCKTAPLCTLSISRSQINFCTNGILSKYLMVSDLLSPLQPACNHIGSLKTYLQGYSFSHIRVEITIGKDSSHDLLITKFHVIVG